jgi:hypothetical protein
LCPDCHRVQHIGLAEVNGWTLQQAKKEIDRAWHELTSTTVSHGNSTYLCSGTRSRSTATPISLFRRQRGSAWATRSTVDHDAQALLAPLRDLFAAVFFIFFGL